MVRHDLDELNRELDLEFLLERDSIPYRKSRGVSGMQLNLRDCPCCGDARYRTYLNEETGRGNCFVCNATFSGKLGYIKELVRGEWREAIEYAKEALRDQGWRPRRAVEAAVEVGPVKLPNSIALPTEDGRNLVYLDTRGIPPYIVQYFHLRYCNFGWWEYLDEDTGRKRRQNFNETVIIPVFDLDGKLVTFQGRDLTNQRDSKYLFPKLLPGTGRYLLNGQNVMLTSEVAMGEGAFDVMAMKAAFDDDPQMRQIVCIGSFGKHLSYGSPEGDDQLGRFSQLKTKGVKTVTIMWDGESKALIAALDASKLLASIGLVARVALLPAGKDPNEVSADVVRAAHRDAFVWTPATDIKMRLRSPYSSR